MTIEPRNLAAHAVCLMTWVVLVGCGTTKSQRATEQLLMSDAVDRSVANIDFRPLAGKTVYLDTQFMKTLKGDPVVSSSYIISSLRQQMLAANGHLAEDQKQAEYVCEVRVGALGTDSHDVIYGIPASRELTTAASLLPNAPMIPAIPEISIAKRQDEMGVAKIAVFAYHRETRQPVWQSGTTKARSKAKSFWLFGAGPFQSGTVYDHTKFAGEDLGIPLLGSSGKRAKGDPLAMYDREVLFVQPTAKAATSKVMSAGYTEKTPAKPAPPRSANAKPKPQEPVASPPAKAKQKPAAKPQPKPSPPKKK